MHKQVCVQLTSNSKFLSKFPRKGLLGISDQKAPPPFRKLQIWDDQSLLWNTPPPPPFRKTSDLRWPKFTPKYPPPISENFRFEMTKVYSEIPPTPHFRKLQIWDDQSLLQNTPPPSHFGKLQIWDDQSLLWNTPPPISENFRFEMTKVYSQIPTPPPKKRLGIREIVCGD